MTVFEFLPVPVSHKYQGEGFPFRIYLLSECIILAGRHELITFKKKKTPAARLIPPNKRDELYPRFIPFGPFDVGKLADPPCPLFLIKLSSSANVHFHGIAPSWLRSIVAVRGVVPQCNKAVRHTVRMPHGDLNDPQIGYGAWVYSETMW